jgi:ribosome-associated toxin RatA of RatAB toxin-antitoxin module
MGLGLFRLIHSVRQSQVVAYSPEQMFDLVNDINSYPLFLYWVKSATVKRAGDHYMEASLEVGLGGFSKSFTTHNRLQANSCIELELVSGPFKQFKGAWYFEEKAPDLSNVILEIDFEMSLSPLSKVFGIMFKEVSLRQLNAFLVRAKVVYGA